MITTKIIIRPEKVDKKGFATLYLRITYQRKIFLINLEYKIFAAFYDTEKMCVNKKHDNCYNVNLFINKQKSKADNIILKFSV